MVNNKKINHVKSIVEKRMFHYFLKARSLLRFIFRHTRRKHTIKGKYGIYYKIDPTSALDQLIEKRGISSDWIAHNLHKIIPKNGIIFDIGAHVGHVSLVLAKVVAPQGQVHAFEPDKAVYMRLLHNVRLNKLQNLFAVGSAVSDINKKNVILNTRRVIDLDGLVNKGLSTIINNPLHRRGTTKVSSITLDTYVKKRALHNAHAIKIDVEGAEYKVLRGAKNLIKTFRPIIVYEHSPIIDAQTKTQNSLQSFLFLKRLGYMQYVIQDEKKLVFVKNLPDKHRQQNILAVHTSALKNRIIKKIVPA